MTKDEIEAIEKARELGLPATWEEIYEMTEFSVIDSSIAELTSCLSTDRGVDIVEVRLSKEEAESHLAFLKLRVLRDIYRKDWKPDWNDKSVKHVIKVSADSPIIYGDFCVRSFLSFSDTMTAYLFYENFKDLIWQAKDLI